MAFGLSGTRRVMIVSAVLIVLLSVLCPFPATHAAMPSQYINAFSVSRLPDGYAALETFFASLRDTGANTLIIDLPLTEAGFPAMNVIPNAVYLAHQAGLKLSVVLPTRLIRGPITLNDDWEDLRYDPATETYQRTGKLDLFHQPAVDYLAALAKELAAFSVDGLLFGGDFTYSPIEGMGRSAVRSVSSKLGSDMQPSKLYRKIEKGPEGPFVQSFTELFQRWTAIKRDQLINVYQMVRKAARSVNSTVKIGIQIPVKYPVMNTGDIFTQFAYDMNAWRNNDIDHFWANIEYREIQKQQSLTYRQTTELVSRIAQAVVNAARDASKTILMVPMTDDLTARSLPYSEVEEITALIRASGETGIAYRIMAGSSLNREFTNKLFRRQ